MDFKISNYSIVCKALQILCKRLDCDFIDLPVKFDNVDYPCFKDGCIFVKNEGNLLDTMASVYSVYVNDLSSICGRNVDNMEARHDLMKFFISLLRDFKTEYSKQHVFDENDVIAMKLDQFHVVWMLIKNIFCPYKNLPLQNIKVVAKSSFQFDVAIAVMEVDDPYLFVNLDIEKDSVRSAFILVESLRILLKDKEAPEAVIRETFSNFFMKDRLMDFLGVVFPNDSDIANFFAALSILCQSTEMEEIAMGFNKTDTTKTAQTNPYVGNFWFLGLTEKMLDSVRGEDWSTTKSLKDFSKDLWDRVEVERKSRGLSELPFELLLRAQGDELTVPPNQTLQHLLSKTRIW